jgi:signal transduction histidine kinase
MTLYDSISTYQIGKSMSILEDKSGNLTFKDILSGNSSQFKQSKEAIPHFGFSKSAFWFRFQTNDSSSAQRTWVCEIAMPIIHNVDFYITHPQGLIDSCKTGFANITSVNRSAYRNPSIEFVSNPGENRTVYVRIKTETSIIAPIKVFEKQHYIKSDRFKEFLLGLYFGAVFILALCHFYLYLSTKDRGYLWLSLFALCFSFNQMITIYGYLSDWGINPTNWHMQFMHIPNYLAVLFALLLSRYFINSKIYTPKTDYVLKIMQYVILALIPITPFLGFRLADQIFLFTKIIPMPLYVISAILAYRSGYRPALFYLLAAINFMIGIAIYNMMYGFAILPFNSITFFAPNVTFLLTLLLFSICITDKINTFKQQHEKIRAQALIDLNDKLRLKEEKTQMEKALAQSHKMEVVGRLLGGVAHDMNNLLNPIINYAKLLKKSCSTNQYIAKDAESLLNATLRLKDLSKTLVDVSRKEPVKNVSLNINDLLMEISSLLKHSAPKKVSLKLALSTEQHIIQADPGMLHSAIVNVAVNAFDAMPDGGVVTIGTGELALDNNNPLLRKFECKAGTYAFISVIDTGMGIDELVMTHLFEPFYTTKKNGKGTGLGLVGVYNCIKAHNGCIEVNSSRGEGTKITFFLPLNTIPSSHSENDGNDKHSPINAIIVEEHQTKVEKLN